MNLFEPGAQGAPEPRRKPPPNHYARVMKTQRMWALSAGLVALGSGVLGTGAQAATLADALPAGALLTLETQNAKGAFDRLLGLGADLGEMFGDEGEVQDALDGVREVLAGSLAQEGTVGVFAVGQPGKPFMPQVLGVTRATGAAADVFADLVGEKKGARVGNFTFHRQGSLFVGTAQGLVYFSSDKDLLMGYLGRLSGKNAPRLGSSPTYTVPTRSLGAQELSMYLNFSATAQVVRSQLDRIRLPRLLSPLVDALDTLGQYAGGFTTTKEGLSAASAQVVNRAGKDTPLARMLTHQTTFGVQDIVPADAESVRASACAPESGAYTARWLTRLDLFEPFGFLTDSQLASHLERSGQYLGDECAQVTLAGGARAGLQLSDPLASLNYTVSYHRVRDRAAAEAHLPEYAASVNRAIAGLGESLDRLIKEEGGLPGAALPGGLNTQAATDAALSGLGDVGELLGSLKMVYGFRGDYLVIAFRDAALQAALDPARPALKDDAAFRAADLPLTGAGWQFGRNLPDFSAEDFSNAVLGATAPETEQPETERAEPAPRETPPEANLTPEERAALDELDALLAGEGTRSSGADAVTEQIGAVASDLINRYDGMNVSKSVRGNVVLGKANVLYRW